MPHRAPAVAQEHAVVEHDVLVLAGGGGTRLGGVDKARLEVAGRPLLARLLEGLTPARQVVVVGDTAVPEGVLRTVEDPPGGGPVAGIVAGLGALARTSDEGTAPRLTDADRGPAAWTLVIAVDQPAAAEAAPDLLTAARTAGPEIELLCPHDATGHPQWLLAAYRTEALLRALAPHGSGHGVSVRRLVADLRTGGVTTAHVGDIDTWEDHAAWQARLAASGDGPDRPAGPGDGRHTV